MSTGTATEQLDRIEEILKEIRDQAAAYHADALNNGVAMLDAVQALLVGTVTDPLSIKYWVQATAATVGYIPEEIQYLNAANSDQNMQIIATLEQLNLNGAVNARNQQVIQLAAGGCCDETGWAATLPEQLCQRAQAVYDRWVQIVEDIAGLSSVQGYPSTNWYYEHFSIPEYGTNTGPYISDEDIKRITSQLADHGMNILSDFLAMVNDPIFRQSFINTVNGSQSAQEAYNRIVGGDYDPNGASDAASSLIRYFFTPKLYNAIFDPEKPVQWESYSPDYCTNNPPSEWPYTDEHQVLINDALNQFSPFNFSFGGGSTVGVAGDEYQIAIISCIGTFAGCNIIRTPMGTNDGFCSDVGDTGGTVIIPSQTGGIIGWGSAPSGQTYTVTYQRRLRPA